MKKTDTISERIFSREEIPLQSIRWRLKSKTIGFTNGVFDILHQGHIKTLSEAATFSDILIVGVNSDASVKRLKGESRPINDERARALILASLIMVDAVVIFDEDTPLELIKSIKPDVLVKGGDYTIDNIVGAKEVTAANGEVKIISLEPGLSTSNIIDRIRQL